MRCCQRSWDVGVNMWAGSKTSWSCSRVTPSSASAHRGTVSTGSLIATTACIVCHGRRFQPYRSIRSHLEVIPEGLDRGPDVHVTISRCQDCGLLRLEATGNESVHRLYTEESISYAASLSKLREPADESVYSADEFQFMPGPPGRLLDVGCSSGYFLRRARCRGWDAYGLDLDPRAVAHARAELGLNVKHGSLSNTEFPSEWFDVVTLWGVLEHLPDPIGQLRIVHRLLRADGQLVIAVPNAASLNQAVARLSQHGWDMFCEPGHLYHYDHRTLTRLLAQSGFRDVRWGTATSAIRGKVPFWPW